MILRLAISGLMFAATAQAQSAFPNKKGKKIELPLVVGVQINAIAPKKDELVIGAGPRETENRNGDFGLLAPIIMRERAKKPSIGYNPSLHFGNK